MGYLGERKNKFGTPVSAFQCNVCGEEFTICPAVRIEKRAAYEKAGCGDAVCDSYDPRHDANILFGDYSMLQKFCNRKGIPIESMSSSLIKDSVHYQIHESDERDA